MEYIERRSKIKMAAGISSFFPSPSLLLLNTYYRRKHILGSSCMSCFPGWNSSQECQGWEDLELPRKSTKSAGLGSRKSESSPEVSQWLPLWVPLHSLLSPTQNTHTHTQTHTHPSFRFDKMPHSCRTGKWLCHPDKTNNWSHFFNRIKSLLFQSFG